MLQLKQRNTPCSKAAPCISTSVNTIPNIQHAASIIYTLYRDHCTEGVCKEENSKAMLRILILYSDKYHIL